MSPLGKFILVMFFLVSFDVYAKDISNNEILKKCDSIIISDLNDVYEQIDCYLNVGDNLIENYYSVNAEYVKQKWKNYVQSVVDMNFELENSADKCMSTCGLYDQIDASLRGAEEVRKMIEYIIEEHKK